MTVFLVIAAVLIAGDYIIRERIEAEDAETFPRELDKTGGKLLLWRNHNEGFPFGFMKDNPEVVKYVPLVLTSASAGIWLHLLTSGKARLADKIGYTLLTAGAAGNLLDRIRRGYVVDYVSVKAKGIEKVVFNMADVCILLGSIMVAISSLISPRDVRLYEKAKKERAAVAEKAATVKASIKASRKAMKKLAKAQKAMEAAQAAAMSASQKKPKKKLDLEKTFHRARLLYKVQSKLTS